MRSGQSTNYDYYAFRISKGRRRTSATSTSANHVQLPNAHPECLWLLYYRRLLGGSLHRRVRLRSTADAERNRQDDQCTGVRTLSPAASSSSASLPLSSPGAAVRPTG